MPCGALSALLLVAVSTQATGSGAYSVSIGRDKPMVVSRITFGETGVVAAGELGSAVPRMSVTTSAGSELLPTLIRTCIGGGRLDRVVATYTDALGHVEYTVEFKRPSVVAVELPTLHATDKVQGDAVWTVASSDAHLNFNFGKETGGDAADRDRLRRAHERLRAAMWSAVQHQAWSGPTDAIDVPDGGPFAVRVSGRYLTGIQLLGPFVVTHEPGEKAVFAPLTLVMDADQARVYAEARHEDSLELVYHRADGAGAASDLCVTLKGVLLKAEEQSPDETANKRASVLASFDGVDVQFRSA